MSTTAATLWLHRAYAPSFGMPVRHAPRGRARAVPLRRHWIAAVLSVSAALLALDAGWIHAKAWLAQVLLDHAWAKTLQDHAAHRPWPWADGVPVAKLSVPRLDIEQIALEGDSGRALAFGPGWSPASARPGERGLSVLSGHRDTHFAWLRELRVGDVVTVQGLRDEREFRVVETAVADARRQRVDVASGEDALLLVTCYPFDAITAGGSLRYVVRLLPVAEARR